MRHGKALFMAPRSGSRKYRNTSADLNIAIVYFTRVDRCLEASGTQIVYSARRWLLTVMADHAEAGQVALTPRPQDKLQGKAPGTPTANWAAPMETGQSHR
jgi:hypothetical protein